MWELDHKEAWVLKNWCFWTIVLGKILESPLDCKEIKGVSPKGNQSWIFTGRTDAEAETPILWTSDLKSRFIEKTLMLGKIDGRRRSGNRGWDGWMASLTWEMEKDREYLLHSITCKESDMSEQLNNILILENTLQYYWNALALNPGLLKHDIFYSFLRFLKGKLEDLG